MAKPVSPLGVVHSATWARIAQNVQSYAEETADVIAVAPALLSITLPTMTQWAPPATATAFRMRRYATGSDFTLTGCRSRRNGGVLFKLEPTLQTVRLTPMKYRDERMLYAEATIEQMQQMLGTEFDEFFERVTGGCTLAALCAGGKLPPRVRSKASGLISIDDSSSLQNTPEYGTW